MNQLIRGLVVTAVLAASGWAAPSTASAAEYYYFGNPTLNLFWPYCGSTCVVEVDDGYRNVAESSARTVNTRTVCAATIDTQVVCSDDVALKALCGCQSRLAYSRSTYFNPVPQGRARVLF